MGYMSSQTDTIEGESIRKLCRKEYDTFVKVAGDDIDIFARQVSYDDLDDDKVAAALEALQKAFEKKTKLKLFLNYHDLEEEGDRYDDVDGLFWEVVGMWQLSPAGKKYKRLISRKSYVTFG